MAASGLFHPQAIARLLTEIRQPPQDPDGHYRRMRQEWLLMLVLSIQILHRQFIAKEAPCFHDIQ